MTRKYTYKPHIVLIRSGKKTRSAKAIDELMNAGMSYGQAEQEVINQYIKNGKIRGTSTPQHLNTLTLQHINTSTP